jgi:hypothetical protein
MNKIGLLDGMAARGRREKGAGSEAAAPRLTVTAITPDELESIESEWRNLQAAALDDTPFLSPDFLLPAIRHLSAEESPDLIAVWEGAGESRRLVGLLPLHHGVAGMGDVWTRPRKAKLWRHPLQPFAAPMLAGSHDRATRTVEALFDWLESLPGIQSFAAEALQAGTAAAHLITRVAERRRLPVLRRKGRGLTRGLAFRPVGLRAAADAVTLATEPAELRSALERLLWLDGRGALHQPIAIDDPMQTAMLRATVRSFGRGGRAVIAETGESRAGALFLIGRDRAYLWRTFGEGAADPVLEAALVIATERRLGLPITAASTRPLCGAGIDGVPTETLVTRLSSDESWMVARLRLWIG